MLFKQICQSLTARRQNYTIRHYSDSKFGKKLSQFRNIHSGKRCFLIGNGPSLRASDLDTLHRAGEITFAFNRIYNIFDQTEWRPTYYISQDEKMLEGSINIVNQQNLGIKFIPIQMNWYFNLPVENAVYFNLTHQEFENPCDSKFGDDFTDKIYNSSTCMYTAAQIAAYMGFTEIYLIGVDHHFQISKNNKGEIVVDNTVKDYFSDQYNADKDKLYIPNTEKSTLTYIAMKHHCKQRNIKVYNATRGGKLEVFPRKEFDHLF